MDFDYKEVLKTIQQEVYKSKSNRLSPEMVLQLNALTQQIQSKRKIGKQSAQPKFVEEEPIPFVSPSRTNIRQEITPTKAEVQEKPKRMKPSFIRLRNEVFSPECLDECILQFLTLQEVLEVRAVSRNFNQGALMHLAERIVDEEKSIENMIFSTEEATQLIKELVILQLPEVKGQWLNLNTEKLIDTLGDVFTRTDLESLKFLHNIPDKYDDFFAPFCVAFKLRPARITAGDNTWDKSWKRTFLAFVSQASFVTKLLSHDLREITEENAIELLKCLNNLSSREKELQRVSHNLYLTVQWCRTVFCIYLSKNLYKVRFSEKFTSEEDLKIIKLLEQKVNFTRRLKKMISFETNEPYLLDMSDYKTKKTIKFNFVRDFDESLIKLVVSYLEIKEIIWGRAVSKKFKNAIDDYIRDLVTIGIYYFEKAKIQKAEISKKVPLLYELGFFSNAFDVVYSILKMRGTYFSKSELDEFKRIKVPNKAQENVCRIYCLLYNLPAVREFKMDDAFVKLHYFSAVKNLLVSKNFNTFAEKYDLFDINKNVLIEADQLLDALDTKQLGSEDSIFTNFSKILKAIVVFYKIMNPLIFIPKKFLSSRLTKEELQLVSEILEKYDDCIFFLRVASRLKLIDMDQQLKNIKNYLTPEEKKVSDSFRKPQFDEVHEVFHGTIVKNNEYTMPFFLQKITGNLLNTYEYREKELSAICPMKGEVVSSPNKGKSPINSPQRAIVARRSNAPFDFKKIDLVMIKSCLGFLTLEEVEAFSRVNKACNQIYKVYMHIRIFVETARVKEIEQESGHLAESIQAKRDQFYKDFEVQPPSREHAVVALTEISPLQVSELKKLKNSSTAFDKYVIPFTILFEEVFKRHKIDIKGAKNKWTALQKLMQQTDLYKLLSSVQVEVLDNYKMFELEKYLQKSEITPEEAYSKSLAMGHLIKWFYGLIEIHKFIRKYYLSAYDFEILNEEEINFARDQDRLQLRSYKIMRAMETHWPEHRQTAQLILESMHNLPSNEMILS